MGDWIVDQPKQYYFCLTQKLEFQSLGLDRTLWSFQNAIPS